nr:MAG TPA: hypothetical protein [Caudoviricetes sp.]
MFCGTRGAVGCLDKFTKKFNIFYDIISPKDKVCGKLHFWMTE